MIVTTDCPLFEIVGCTIPKRAENKEMNPIGLKSEHSAVHSALSACFSQIHATTRGLPGYRSLFSSAMEDVRNSEHGSTSILDCSSIQGRMEHALFEVSVPHKFE